MRPDLLDDIFILKTAGTLSSAVDRTVCIVSQLRLCVTRYDSHGRGGACKLRLTRPTRFRDLWLIRDALDADLHTVLTLIRMCSLSIEMSTLSSVISIFTRRFCKKQSGRMKKGVRERGGKGEKV